MRSLSLDSGVTSDELNKGDDIYILRPSNSALKCCKFCLEIPGSKDKRDEMLTVHQTESSLGETNYCLLEQFETDYVILLLTQGQGGSPAMCCQHRQHDLLSYHSGKLDPKGPSIFGKSISVSWVKPRG